MFGRNTVPFPVYFNLFLGKLLRREITLLLYFGAKFSRKCTLSLYFPANDIKPTKRLSIFNRDKMKKIETCMGIEPSNF
jgi:hypothetical protein